MPEGAGQPGLAGPGRPGDQQVLMAFDPLPAGQLLEQGAIQTAGGAMIDVLRCGLLFW